VFLQVVSIYNILEYVFLELFFQSNFVIIRYYFIVLLQIFYSYLLEYKIYLNTICTEIELHICTHKVSERFFFFLMPIFIIKNKTTTQDTLGGFNVW
jgi:hypothetical protein